ncbi:hypothetical protein OIU84_025527 [Salix udensis]|uniref:RRM domain-containing protein n=1 Tax=Salix udensis TaxID=889485 RepID=A0AAD6KJR2_9ROSI|nr:hypothetical protein OIU84_025527 [Salix udensis]
MALFLILRQNQSPNPWPVHGLPNNSDSKSSISPKSSPFLSYDNIRSGSVLVPPFSRNGGGVCSNNGADFLGEYQSDDHLSFLEDPLFKKRGIYGNKAISWVVIQLLMEMPICIEGDFQRVMCVLVLKMVVLVLAIGRVYILLGVFAKMEKVASSFMVAVQQQQEVMMKMKAVQRRQQQQRLAYNKHMNFLLLKQNEAERFGTAMTSDEFYKFGRTRGVRNDFLAMGMAEMANSASRQIYLTFPAESSFKDEDVSNYFSSFGPVQDVRIPYQHKRMFGFVTFVYPETVKEILAKGNPHYICESRVLVKPYKEKGKVANNRMQQLLERGSFSPALSPTGFDPRELCDLHHGARMLNNTPEMMLRMKLEEQAELQQAIELQERRLINLQLPDLRGDHAHRHEHSVSVGATHHTSICQTDILNSDDKDEITLEDNGNRLGASKSTPIPVVAENLQDEVNAACIQNNDTVNCKVESFTKSHGSNLEHDSLTKSYVNQHPDIMSPSRVEVEESNELSISSFSENDASRSTKLGKIEKHIEGRKIP